MDNIDILDSKVKDIINTKGELENKIEVLEIKVNEYNEIIKSLEDKNRLYKDELKNIIVELENVIKKIKSSPESFPISKLWSKLARFAKVSLFFCFEILFLYFV